MNPDTQPSRQPAPRIEDYRSVQDYLFSLKSSGVRYGVERMRRLASLLGNPERAQPCIHITGTNGKGSTAAMLESILRGAGWLTGLYTSPHLVRLGERIQVAREILGERAVAELTLELRPQALRMAGEGEDMHPTFFEFMTAMAFLEFRRRRCDIAVVEVGMGGEFDATNIVRPEVSVITSVALDHCEMLGDTLGKIAATKSGIIKPGVPVVIGRLPPEAERVVREVAAARGSPLYSVREAFGDNTADYPVTNLAGDYQRWNAATASLAARLLGPAWRLDEAAIARGLGDVSWPGRWEERSLAGRHLVFDASHNPEGAQVLDLNFSRLVGRTGRKPVVVVGVLGASRAGPLLEVVCRHASELLLVVPGQARACSHAELEALIPAGFSGTVRRGTVEELFPGPGLCTAGAPGGEVVVTGSIYLLGEILTRLEPERGAGEGRLQDF